MKGGKKQVVLPGFNWVIGLKSFKKCYDVICLYLCQYFVQVSGKCIILKFSIGNLSCQSDCTPWTLISTSLLHSKQSMVYFILQTSILDSCKSAVNCTFVLILYFPRMSSPVYKMQSISLICVNQLLQNNNMLKIHNMSSYIIFNTTLPQVFYGCTNISC